MLENNLLYYAKLIESAITCKINAEEHLKSFRQHMNNEKLFPPGRVWTIVKNAMAGLEIREVLDVKHRFGELRFVGGMKTHHNLPAGEKSLEILSVTCCEFAL